MWCFDAPIDENRPLHEHIMALWNTIPPNIPYLRAMK
jgi:hypothetical protein